MAQVARVWNFERVGLCRTDEPKRVAANVHVAKRLSDFRHMAGRAGVAGTSLLMMRVFFDAVFAWTVWRPRTVTVQAQFVRRLAQQGAVFGAMRFVASEARDAVSVHEAGDVVVALHAVLMRGSVSKMRERRFAQPVWLQLPIITQLESHVKAHRPVVVFPFDGTGQRSAL